MASWETATEAMISTCMEKHVLRQAALESKALTCLCVNPQDNGGSTLQDGWVGSG